MSTTSPRPLADAFPVVRGWLDGGTAEDVPATLADEIARRFGIDAFARNLLLLGAYVALEPDAADHIGRLHEDPRRTSPTIGLALARLPGANWRSLAADSPLRANGLIALDRNSAVAGAGFALPEPALFALLGAPALGEELAAQSRPALRPPKLTAARMRLADEIALRLAHGRRELLQLCGPDPVGKEHAAAEAAHRNGRTLHVLNAAMLPMAPQDIARLAQTWRRDLTLVEGMLFVDAASLSDVRPLALFADLVGLPLIIAAPESLALGHLPSLRIDMGRSSAAEQLPLWREQLGGFAKTLNGSVERLASHFAASPELAGSVAAELAIAMSAKRDKKTKLDFDAIAWDAARRFARPRMDDLARRVESAATWDDLVLPKQQIDTLKAIAAQVRNRVRVYEQWGFAKRSGGRGLGVSALFAGPSGAGKTMAGEILGAELRLDVYRIDLSAIVSKWIGETEKNLRRVFDAAEDGCAILQFDECDALFGKRSEVKDSHDRHANIEVSYLLQRLEQYRGLSILTTNLRNNIDSAFLRRLRFIVEFSFPSHAERVGIWRGIFPAETPTRELDFERLGQLNLAGGSIRNIAMSAAFLAAEERDIAVGMDHILAAARLEYTKSGRALTDAELRGWR